MAVPTQLIAVLVLMALASIHGEGQSFMATRRESWEHDDRKIGVTANAESISSGVTQEIKTRRHNLRRRIAKCNIPCYNYYDCQLNVYKNAHCSDFSSCVQRPGGGFCASARNGAKCGTPCRNQNQCANNVDTCSSCIGGFCVPQLGCDNRCNSSQQCNQNSSCNTCVNTYCVNVGNGPKCQQDCTGLSTLCQTATDGCTVCSDKRCQRPACGTECRDGADCSLASQGCNICLRGRCSNGRRNGGRNGNCANSEQSLRDLLGDGGQVAICGTTTITLAAEITVEASNVDLQCLQKPCKVIGSKKHRLIDFLGTNISINDIAFQNGRARGDNAEGGAIKVTGSASISGCIFILNEADSRGGAVSVGSGTLTQNTYVQNFAPQCVDVYEGRSCRSD